MGSINSIQPMRLLLQKLWAASESQRENKLC